MKFLITILATIMAVSQGLAEITTNKGKTADDQSASTQTGTDLVRMIREKIVADDSLSTNAHNIKIISDQNGITLKGVVASAAERQKVESLAKSVAGRTSVINRTEISK